MTAWDGLVVLDKPTGLTSHDVVARVRRLAGQRRVGHAGTLDPMATGVLVVGLGRATRLLGHVSAASKEYEATIRLGVSTTTDDAAGEALRHADASAITAEQLGDEIRRLTGDLLQVPSSVSAVKVDGQRAYRRVRAGEGVDLPARPVQITRFEIMRPPVVAGSSLDVDVEVEVSSGTYVRALARDLGVALGVGGHLRRLRRTRVGSFGLARARTLEDLAERFEILELDEAVSVAFPRRDVDAEAATAAAHGRPLPRHGANGPVGVFGPDGHVVALMGPSDRPHEDLLRVVVGLAG